MEGECRKLNFGGGDDDDDEECKGGGGGGGVTATTTTTTTTSVVGLPMERDDWLATKNTLCKFLSEVRVVDNPWMLEPYSKDYLVKSCNLSSFDIKISTKTYEVICALALEIDEGNWARTAIHVPSEGNPVIVSQRQAASLLACAFLNLFPFPESGRKSQHFLLSNWSSEIEKLRCLANYFKVIRKRLADDPNWTGSSIGYFHRKLPSGDFSEQIHWESCRYPLKTFALVNGDDASIEFAKNTLQADFANEYIGGGVLHGGCVQEEIRFTISPECLCSILFCDMMNPSESIMIRGTEIYSSSSGYAWSFKFESTYTDDTEIDNDGYRDTWLVALDAIPYVGYKTATQFKSHNIVRDLRKCLVATMEWPREREQIPGFSTGNESKRSCGVLLETGTVEELKPFATGNWGCGAFGGDPELKSIQQWLACSMAGRNLQYFTRRESWPELQDIISLISSHNERAASSSAAALSGLPDTVDASVIDVGELSKILFEFGPIKAADESVTFFSFLRGRIREKMQ